MSNENCKESCNEEGDKARDIKLKLEADQASSSSLSPDAEGAVGSADAADNQDIKEPQVTNPQLNNPLHGLKLVTIVEKLEAQYGWDGLAYRININCFKSDPSVKSSLKFLRRTPWARDKVERLYLKTFHKKYRPESY